MFDIAPTELLLVALVALLVIGPSDLPKAMRVVGHWMGRARGMARHFRSGLDEMIRQSEMQEMEKRWAEENARIMREHPAGEPDPEALADGQAAAPFPDPAIYDPPGVADGGASGEIDAGQRSDPGDAAEAADAAQAERPRP